MLDDILNTELYGQDIAHHVVINALRGHLSSSNPPKALAMSFHGPPGTGKTYVAQMIAQSFYQKSTHSQFYHFFNGRNDFPLEKDVERYKVYFWYNYTFRLKIEEHMYIMIHICKLQCKLFFILCYFVLYRKNYVKLSSKV